MNRCEQFEADLERLAEAGAFDVEAERLIDKRASKNKPFGIERARQKIVDRLYHAWLDTGWALFDYDGSGLHEVQRDDEANVFESDDDALDFVKNQAAKGSKKHVKALDVHRRDELKLIKLRSQS